MKIKCGNCGKSIIVPDDIVAGQHVRCPYCDVKSAFDKPSRVVLPTDIRPILKHVQPSGRGMQSEHELAAKRAAVESIEKRIDHNEAVRKRAERKRAIASFGSVVLGLVLLAAAAYYLVNTTAGLRERLHRTGWKQLDSLLSPSSPTNLSDFSEVALSFSSSTLTYWKDAPKELNPKHARKGTVYHALVPNGGKYRLFELKTGNGGKVAELTPFGNSIPMTTEDFRKTCGDKAYFLSCEGRVFVCGGGDLQMMDELRKALLPRDADRRRQDAEMR